MTQAVENPPKTAHGAKFWPLSVQAYHLLAEAGLIPENTELLYGFVYTKMSKSPFHSYLFEFLQELLRSVLKPGKLLRTEQPLSCAESEPEPDLAVVAGKKEDFRTAHPHTAELVIEVCITSHEYDRLKLSAYATAGVKECWLVLGPEKQIEVFTKPENGEYSERTLYGPGWTLTSVVLPEFSIALDSLFAK